MITVALLNTPPVKYGELTPEKVREIFAKHVVDGTPVMEYAIDSGSEFFKKQLLLVLKNTGTVDLKARGLLARDGDAHLEKARTLVIPENVIEEVIRSGLREKEWETEPHQVEGVRGEKNTPQTSSGIRDEGDREPTWTGACWNPIHIPSSKETTIAAYAIGVSGGFAYVPVSTPCEENNHWRLVTIESDSLTGEIIVRYKMPNGEDVKRYSQKEFRENAAIPKVIVFHVTP